MEEDLYIGHGKGDLLKVGKDHSKSYRAFQEIVKRHFSKREVFWFESK